MSDVFVYGILDLFDFAKRVQQKKALCLEMAEEVSMQASSKQFLFPEVPYNRLGRTRGNGHNVLYIFQELPVKLELCYRKAFTIGARLFRVRGEAQKGRR